LAPAELICFDLEEWQELGDSDEQAYRRWGDARSKWLAAHAGSEEALGNKLERLRATLPYGWLHNRESRGPAQ
jgi:hypothetical protein